MNSLEFKNFKLHTDSTLKSLTKDELVSYIDMLCHNWGAADEQLCNVIEINAKLDKALDKACKELFLMFDDIDDIKSTWNKEEWKEWAMKDVD